MKLKALRQLQQAMSPENLKKKSIRLSKRIDGSLLSVIGGWGKLSVLLISLYTRLSTALKKARNWLTSHPLTLRLRELLGDI